MISQIISDRKIRSGKESVSDPKSKWQTAAMLKFPALSQVRVTRSLVIRLCFLNLSFLSSLVCSHCRVLYLFNRSLGFQKLQKTEHNDSITWRENDHDVSITKFKRVLTTLKNAKKVLEGDCDSLLELFRQVIMEVPSSSPSEVEDYEPNNDRLDSFLYLHMTKPVSNEDF